VKLSTTCVPQQFQKALEIQPHSLKIEILALEFWYVLAKKDTWVTPMRYQTKASHGHARTFMFKTARALFDSCTFAAQTGNGYRTHCLALFDAI